MITTRQEFAVEYQGGLVRQFEVSQCGDSGYEDIVVRGINGDREPFVLTPNLEDLEGMQETLAMAIKHIKRQRKITARKGGE